MGKRLHPWHYLLILGGAVLLAAVVGWHLAKRADRPQQPNPQVAAGEPGKMHKQVVHLYFGDDQGRYLLAEQRVLNQPDDAVLTGRQLVEALIKGPEKTGSRTLPAAARLRSFLISGDKTAYVDFEADSFDDHPGGVGTELLTIYSIVDTLVLNVEPIRSVKILLGGREAATLAGHVDLSRKFKADMLWVR